MESIIISAKEGILLPDSAEMCQIGSLPFAKITHLNIFYDVLREA